MAQVFACWCWCWCWHIHIPVYIRDATIWMCQVYERTMVFSQMEAADVRNVLLLCFSEKEANLGDSCRGHDLRIISVQNCDGVEVTLAVRIRHHEDRDECLTVYCHFNKYEDPLTTVSDVVLAKEGIGSACEKWIEKNCLPERFWDALRSQRDPKQRLIVSGVGYGGLLASVVVQKIPESNFCLRNPLVACVMVSSPIGMMNSTIADDSHFFHIAHERDPICQLINVCNEIGEDRSLFVKWAQGRQRPAILAILERLFTSSEVKERSTSVGNIWLGKMVGGANATFEIQKYSPVQADSVLQSTRFLLENYRADMQSPFDRNFNNTRRQWYLEFIMKLDQELPEPAPVERGYLNERIGTPTVCLRPALQIFREESMERDKLSFSVEVNNPFQLFLRKVTVSLNYMSPRGAVVLPARKVDDGYEVDKGFIYLLKTVSSEKLLGSGCIPDGFLEAEVEGMDPKKEEWRLVRIRRRRASMSSTLTMIEGTLLRSCHSGELNSIQWRAMCDIDQLLPSDENMFAHIFAALVSTPPLEEDARCRAGLNEPLTKSTAMAMVDEYVGRWRGPARTMVQCWFATRVSKAISDEIAAIIEGHSDVSDPLKDLQKSLENLELSSSYNRSLLPAILNKIQSGWSTEHRELLALLRDPRGVSADEFEIGIGWGVQSPESPPLYLQQLHYFLTVLRRRSSQDAISPGTDPIQRWVDKAREFYGTVKGKYPTFPIADVTQLWEGSKKFMSEDELFRVARPRFWHIVFRMLKCTMSETFTSHVRKAISLAKNLSTTRVLISLLLLIAAAATPLDEIAAAIVVIRGLLAATSLTNIIVQLSLMESKTRESLGSLLFIPDSIVSSPSSFDHRIRNLLDKAEVTASSIVAEDTAATGYTRVTELAWEGCDPNAHCPELDEESRKSVCQQLAYHYHLSVLRHSLEGKHGLGIIGRPGSGKSTVANVIKDPSLFAAAVPRTSRVIFDTFCVQNERNDSVEWETIDFTGAFDTDRRLSNIADAGANLLLRDTDVVIIATSADALRRTTSESSDDSHSFRGHIQCIPVDAVKIFYIKGISSWVHKRRGTKETDTDLEIIQKSETLLRTEIYSQLQDLYPDDINPVYIDMDGVARRWNIPTSDSPGGTTGVALGEGTPEKVERGKSYLMFADFMPDSVREDTSPFHVRVNGLLVNESSMVLGPLGVHRAMHAIMGDIVK